MDPVFVSVDVMNLWIHEGLNSNNVYIFGDETDRNGTSEKVQILIEGLF